MSCVLAVYRHDFYRSGTLPVARQSNPRGHGMPHYTRPILKRRQSRLNSFWILKCNPLQPSSSASLPSERRHSAQRRPTWSGSAPRLHAAPASPGLALTPRTL